jgi:hypothetical protein
VVINHNERNGGITHCMANIETCGFSEPVGCSESDDSRDRSNITPGRSTPGPAHKKRPIGFPIGR